MASVAASPSPSVAIVGGGVSGLLALKRLQDAGLDPVLFEATDALGGTWAPGCPKLYPSLHANTARSWMHFADFEFEPPAESPDFPHHAALSNHVLAFARRFDLRRSCRMGSPVAAIRESAAKSGSFEVKVHGEWLHFDRVCLCTGKVSEKNVPAGIPIGAGTLAFHSSDLDRQRHSFVGRHVVVVGFGAASAVDVCELAEQSAASVTVVTSQPVFLAPRMNETSGESVMAGFKFFGTLVPDSIVQKQLRKQLRKYPQDAAEEFTLGLHYLSPCWNLHKLMERGRVAVRLGSLVGCRDGQALLADGSSLSADVVVWCTGYKSQVLAVLDQPLLSKVTPSMPLYEAVWAPRVPGIAMMGQGFAFWWLLELQAQWIAKVWTGQVRLPSAPAMQAWIDAKVAARDAVQRPSLRRLRPYMLPESLPATGVRLAKYIGGWPGMWRVLWRGRETFEPRLLFNAPRAAL